MKEGESVTGPEKDCLVDVVEGAGGVSDGEQTQPHQSVCECRQTVEGEYHPSKGVHRCEGTGSRCWGVVIDHCVCVTGCFLHTDQVWIHLTATQDITPLTTPSAPTREIHIFVVKVAGRDDLPAIKGFTKTNNAAIDKAIKLTNLLQNFIRGSSEQNLLGVG